MKLKLLIIHCTATEAGERVTSDMIRQWHMNPPPLGRGWKQVGYSDMIHLNGMIENLVPYDEDDNVDPWEITNGAVGLNSISRHVVYVGGLKNGKPYDTRTDPQRESLMNYVAYFIAKHPGCRVAGHNQFANKACPSFDVPKWLRECFFPKRVIYEGTMVQG